MTGKKIALVGAHGSGKTALAYELAARLKSQHNISVGLTVESARPSQYLLTNELVPEAEIEILGIQLLEEARACKNYDLVICDRSVLEIIMYSRLFFPKPAERIHQKYAKALEEFGKEYIRTYDALFRSITLYDPSLTHDPLRPKDPKLQKKAHKMLKDLLDELSVSYDDIPASNETEFIIKKLKEKSIIC